MNMFWFFDIFVFQVGMLGDNEIGKTELMDKYIDNKFDDDYIKTLGVNFMEKEIHLKNVDVTVSIWDLGGQKEFETLLPLVCVDAQILIFCFDLTQQASLFSVKRWYKEAKKENKSFMPILIGTRFEKFEKMNDNYKQELTRQARKFREKMDAPLIYCSSAQSINVKKIFKIIIAKVFDLKPKFKQQKDCSKDAILEFDPILTEYESV